MAKLRQFYYQETAGDLDTGHRDRIRYLERPEHHRAFVIDREFDATDFTRPMGHDLHDLMLERLRQLRKRYDYLRLWFSGGKDSRVVFDLAIEHDIKFDEIVVIDQRPAGDFLVGVQREIRLLAMDYLAGFDLPHTKVSLVSLEPHHYNSVFVDPQWIHHYLYHSIHAPMHPPLFFRYVNPEFNLIEKCQGIGEVCGSVHPLIRHDDHGNFGFFFVDRQFAMEGCDYDVENFLVTGDMPDLALAYVRDLIQTYRDRGEPVPDFLSNERSVRDRLPVYSRIKLPDQHAMLPKCYDGSWHPDDHELWPTNHQLKQWLHCLACAASSEHNEAWQNYRDLTDWQKVRFSNQHPGVVTQTYWI